MTNIMKYIAGAFVLLGAGYLVFWLYNSGTINNTNNINFILAHCYNGKIIDLQNEIGVRSGDDIKWYLDKQETIVIEYGKILLKYKVTDFITSEVQAELNSVFITTRQHKETKEFILSFQGKDLIQYAKT